jgi:hypothetical protein
VAEARQAGAHCRSAIDENVPQADLVVSAAHALLLDGVLVTAGDLVNGTTIAFDDDDGDRLEYFHIKLSQHDAVDAEGLACESLLAVPASMTELPEATLCAPKVSYSGGRGEVASRLRSAISPWFDRRQPLDIVRDRLEERALARL